MKKRGVVGRINSKHGGRKRERERVFSGGSRDWVTVTTPLRSFFSTRRHFSLLFLTNLIHTSSSPPLNGIELTVGGGSIQPINLLHNLYFHCYNILQDLQIGSVHLRKYRFGCKSRGEMQNARGAFPIQRTGTFGFPFTGRSLIGRIDITGRFAILPAGHVTHIGTDLWV